MDTLISEASILLIVLILALIFFICGIIHLLVRYLLAAPGFNRRHEFDVGTDGDNATALQGQLQQLFHLHDCGVDQLYIDALPVFPYRAIVGCLGDPFDCAVCLCEFELDSKLRLLPDCSHAFHIDCIDTWLLAHSTCPLCRSSLLAARERAILSPARASDASSPADTGESEADELVVQVKLGKFRSVDAGAAEELDQRRCFSMGSYEYVMNESSLLRVAVKPRKRDIAKSECDCHSRRRELIKGFDGSNKKESYSVSKIWMRSARGKAAAESGESSRRAVSFRLPLSRECKPTGKAAAENGESLRRAVSFRLPLSRECKPTSDEDERGGDVEAAGSCSNSVVSVESQIPQTPSFARRTLLWIVNR